SVNDTDDEPDDQKLEAHYLYMAQIQEVTPDTADNSGPIFDAESLQTVQNDNDNYNVFDNDKEHPEMPKSVNVTYLKEHGDTNITTDSLDMSNNGGEADPNEDGDFARECDLLASLIDKLKCEIDDSKNRNKLLESSNKTLLDKLKGEIKDFKTKNKSLESSNNYFKEANNELLKTNQLMFKDLKKFQAKLDRYHDVNYASKVEIDYAKAKGDLMSYKMESRKSFNEEYYYADHMNAILGVYTKLDEVTNLHCDYLEALEKCQSLENELSKRDTTSKSFEALQQHSINLELALQQSREQLNNEKVWKQKESNSFRELNVKYFEIQDLKAQLQDKDIVIRVIPTTSVSRPQLKRNQLEDSVMHNNIQGNKQQVEDHRRNFKFSNNKTSVTACNDSLNAKTSTINFVKGLNHNLFSVGQFCDADLEVAFRKSTCYILDLKGNDLLIGSRGTDLYFSTLQDTSTPNPICLMAKATSWLWHRRLSHLNFDTINLLSKYDIVTGLTKLKFVKYHLCSSCELGKAKRKSHKTKTTPSSKRQLQILHMDLCGPMRVESFNDETPEVLIDFLKLVQRGLHAQVRIVRTDKGTEFLIKTLHAYFAQEGIEHHTSTPQTPEQNSVVE
ncbi:retrovirus-related pol polyprotein from transposon TNT 1-94, partial [Tanacetum coccineum]